LSALIFNHRNKRQTLRAEQIPSVRKGKVGRRLWKWVRYMGTRTHFRLIMTLAAIKLTF